MNTGKIPTAEEWLELFRSGNATQHEKNFLADVRHYAAIGVDYKFMQHVIEAEWRSVTNGVGSGPTGPQG